MKYFRKHPKQQTDTVQVSIMAFWESKPKQLEGIIHYCIKRIKETKIGYLFEPFSMNKIHATIIGLEQLQDSDKLYNANLWLDSKQKREMNFDRLFPIVRKHFPFTLRFGGLNKSFNKFTSWGTIPYLRSFQLLCPAGDFTLIGWPYENGNYDNKILWNLRQNLEKYCNIRHKYFKYEDNDFFMRIGRVNDDNCQMIMKNSDLKNEIKNLEREIREYLSRNPVDIRLTLNDLCLVQYREESSHIKIVEYFQFSNNKINSRFIRSLLINPLSSNAVVANPPERGGRPRKCR